MNNIQQLNIKKNLKYFKKQNTYFKYKKRYPLLKSYSFTIFSNKLKKLYKSSKDKFNPIFNFKIFYYFKLNFVKTISSSFFLTKNNLISFKNIQRSNVSFDFDSILNNKNFNFKKFFFFLLNNKKINISFIFNMVVNLFPTKPLDNQFFFKNKDKKNFLNIKKLSNNYNFDFFLFPSTLHYFVKLKKNYKYDNSYYKKKNKKNKKNKNYFSKLKFKLKNNFLLSLIKNKFFLINKKYNSYLSYFFFYNKNKNKKISTFFYKKSFKFFLLKNLKNKKFNSFIYKKNSLRSLNENNENKDKNKKKKIINKLLYLNNSIKKLKLKNRLKKKSKGRLNNKSKKELKSTIIKLTQFVKKIHNTRNIRKLYLKKKKIQKLLLLQKRLPKWLKKKIHFQKVKLFSEKKKLIKHRKASIRYLKRMRNKYKNKNIHKNIKNKPTNYSIKEPIQKLKIKDNKKIFLYKLKKYQTLFFKKTIKYKIKSFSFLKKYRIKEVRRFIHNKITKSQLKFKLQSKFRKKFKLRFKQKLTIKTKRRITSERKKIKMLLSSFQKLKMKFTNYKVNYKLFKFLKKNKSTTLKVFRQKVSDIEKYKDKFFDLKKKIKKKNIKKKNIKKPILSNLFRKKKIKISKLKIKKIKKIKILLKKINYYSKSKKYKKFNLNLNIKKLNNKIKTKVKYKILFKNKKKNKKINKKNFLNILKLKKKFKNFNKNFFFFKYSFNKNNFKKNTYINLIKSKSNFFVFNFISKFFFLNLKKKKTNYFWKKFNLNSIFNIYKESLVSNFKYNFVKFLYFKSSKIFEFKLIKHFKHIINFKKSSFFNINSRSGNLFILKTTGFLFLDNINDSFFLFQRENLTFLRKTIYNFKEKVDLHKFILKKYLNYFFKVETSIDNENCDKSEFVYDLNIENANEDFFFNSLNHTFNFIKDSSLQNLNWKNVFFLQNFKNINFKKKNIYLNSHPLTDIFELHFASNFDFENDDFRIKEFKFKPGYSSHMRRFRKTLKWILNVNFKYQHRLTKYLVRFNKIIRHTTHVVYELQLKNVLTLTKIFPDYSWSSFFINNKVVYINNKLIINENYQLLQNDFIQLIINTRYYIFYKWLNSWNLIKKNKIKTKVNKKKSLMIDDEVLLGDKSEKFKKQSYPSWILRNLYFSEDLPKYIELDFLTLSFFIIYEPYHQLDFNALSFLKAPYTIINLYNWKYIN